MARTVILRTAGTNCDRELAHAFEQAGADSVEIVHVHELAEDPERLEGYDLIGLPGGFSYGDDISAGRIFANLLRHRLGDALRSAVERGVGVIGICNGFQVLVKMGLLPDPADGRQTTTLAHNTDGRFVDRWVKIEPAVDSVCIWTKDLESHELPIAHGEGRFVAGGPEALERLRSNGQVALRYAADDDPNGSDDRIAGLCDPSGRVLGMMPHPERFVHPTHHPAWSRQAPADPTPGLALFRNGVEYVKRAAETSPMADAG
ncbi:MAG: phosphoribosylformylglycinamidine synthase subunit PurQ [Phycisphaeraceae bacterium]|nr:phosphoribosylformylglycinamidine synthase subunit PurQ [Phycisphaeraceae bacterium]